MTFFKNSGMIGHDDERGTDIMLMVYFVYQIVDPGKHSIARYDIESEAYPMDYNDLSYWLVPGTLED